MREQEARKEMDFGREERQRGDSGLTESLADELDAREKGNRNQTDRSHKPRSSPDNVFWNFL